ncbi:hypothetical protein, partial [Endozoicomonas sp. SESOKO4]
MLILLLSALCQGESFPECFIAECGQNAIYPNQSYSVKFDPHILPGNPSVIANTDGYATSDSPPEDKPRKSDVQGINAFLIERISRQLFYATHLRVSYELILTTKALPLKAKPYSSIPVEWAIAVAWLLKCYWNCDSPLINPMTQQEATSMLTQENQTFAIITVMFDSGNNQRPHQQQDPPSDSFGQHVPVATTCFDSFLYSRSGGGNEGPQQNQHTLDFNCFVSPCHGVCQFHYSPDGRGLNEWQPISSESSCRHLTHGHCLRCIGYVDPVEVTPQSSQFERLNLPATIQPQSASDLLFELLTHGIDGDPANSGNSIDGILLDCWIASDGIVSDAISSEADHATDATVPLRDDMPMAGKNRLAARAPLPGGSPPGGSPPGKTTHYQQALSDRKSKRCIRQTICDLTVVGEDGQPRPCGMACKGSQGLTEHKRSVHSEQKICDVIVVGEDGQPGPCGKICRSARSLTVHKSRYHTGQKICDVIAVGK